MDENIAYDILFLDLGWGGLSIVNNLCELLIQKQFAFAYVNLPYRHLKNENINQSFNSILSSLYYTFYPKLIVLVCHTLSLIYHNIQSKDFLTEIFDMYDIVISYINTNNKIKNNNIIIFSGELTNKLNLYKKSLLDIDFSSDKIISIPCSGLARNIDNGNFNEAQKLVYNYVNESLLLLKEKIHVTAILCCTHYQYVYNTFMDAFKSKVVKPIIFNPNLSMQDKIIKYIINEKSKDKNILCDIYHYETANEESYEFFNAIDLHPILTDAIKKAILLTMRESNL